MSVIGYDLFILFFIFINRLRNGENEIGNKKRINKVKLNYCFFEKIIVRLMKKEEERKLGGSEEREREFKELIL